MAGEPKQAGKEWSDKSKYNSFNSFKGLMWHTTHYIPIAKWFEGEGKDLPPPIELSLDPGHLCNFGCAHCNAQRYLVINREEVPEDKRLMTREHLRNLIDFCAKWGVKGVCIGGGGEPLMNKAVWDLPSYIASKGMRSSFATNGSLINENIAKEMMNCRWVGVSVDAGTKEMFKKVHSVDHFDKVIENLRLLVKMKKETGSKIDIAYKFLITPQNWSELYTACKLAKEIGVRDFHARPVDLERKDFHQAMQLNYDIEEIQRLFQKCHELEEGDDFRVFTVMHKYNPEFRVMHTFKKCVSSPLMLQACSDGNVYVCADHRIESGFKLASHYPDPENILKVWGSDEHRKLLQSIRIDEECGRCFVPGTKVTTPEGVKKIESIKKGDLVISGDGKERKVIRVYKNKYEGKLVSITPFGDNRPILTTPYHKFNSIKTDECTAREMKKCLGESCGILKSMKSYRYDLKRCKNPSKKYKVVEVKAEDLKENHLLIYPKLKTSKKNILESDLAWVLGMYIAEGHYDISGRHHRVSFYLSVKEKDIAEKLSRVIEKHFGVKNQKPYIRGSSMTLAFESKKLVELVKPFGNSASVKTIPFNFITKSNTKALGSLLKGYFEGDGHFLNTEKDKTILATTVSESLASQLRIALSSIGIMSCIYKQRKRESQIEGRKINYRNEPFVIRISPSDNAEKIFPDKFKKTRKHPECIYETDSFFAVPLRELKTISYKGYVYNLEVEKDHSYLVNGLVVKNCTYGEFARQIEELAMGTKEDDPMCSDFP
jgi:MoaA/NifB/PqqE/SkfB family radical SAM enzyme/intein/homing endonuclease